MNYTIKDVSEGGDFEVYADNRLVATCGTKEMAENLVETLEAASGMVDALRHVIEDCRMALNGEWDRSDDGFQATKDNAENAVTIFINTGIFRSPDSDRKEKMVIVKCASGALNSNGEPDLFFCRFLLNEADASTENEDGYLPYELVKRLAEREGYEHHWAVCEDDPAAPVMTLCEWHTIPLYDKHLVRVDPVPLVGSIWYLARDNSHWVVYSTTEDTDPLVTLFEVREPEDDSEDLDPRVITGREMVNRPWSDVRPVLGNMMALPRDYAGQKED